MALELVDGGELGVLGFMGGTDMNKDKDYNKMISMVLRHREGKELGVLKGGKNDKNSSFRLDVCLFSFWDLAGWGGDGFE